MSGDSRDRFAVERSTGDVVFAGLALVLPLVLLVQIGEQTQYVEKLQLVQQPGFWPALSLGGMTLAGLFYLIGSFRETNWAIREVSVGAELKIWFSALEWVVWFMAYVTLTPLLGYLLATLLFLVILSFRLGYRSRRYLLISAASAIGIVVLFKSSLSVNIPGGAIYEFLPTGIGGFMMANF